MTDNEIIKALECCVVDTVGTRCWDCPFAKIGDCGSVLFKDTLSLINRQKAKIEGLSYKVEHLEFRLDNARGEAIKEFAERLKFNVTGIPWCEYGPVHREIDNLVKEMVGDGNEN